MKRMAAVWNERPTWLNYSAVILAALLVVIALDLVTNELNTTYYYWDFALYYDMAEHGLIGNHNLWAPFAYRFATPLLAGAMADVSAVSVPDGFKVIAYIGATAQLALVFALARAFELGARRAWIVAAVVALSLYNVKFLIFDVSRPDHLAYPLMVIATLALFQRRIILCLAASCAGLLVREFLIIPPILLVLMLLRDYLRDRSRETLIWVAVVVVTVSLFVIVPRVAIPIKGSGQYVDPVNDTSTLSNLTRAPLSQRRDFNLMFNLVSYTLPVWLLLTPGRVRRAWARLDGYRAFLLIYTALIVILTMYGGTDLWRFVTYLFIPQGIVLAVLLQDERVDWAEIIYLLAAMAVYNKIWQDIPNLLDPYLDFYGGYDNRINNATFERLFQLAVLGVGMLLLRGLLWLARNGWAVGRDSVQS